MGIIEINSNVLRSRDSAIDFLKFIAVLLITWSHFDVPLGKFSYLATGGSFGDTLFFFISGYTLLLSNKGNSFFNWYKRRINRIYPTVFAWALISSLIFREENDFIGVILYGGGPFVSYILLFYIAYYPIKKHISVKLYKWIVLILYVMWSVVFFFIDITNIDILRHWQWCSFFMIMLIGAKIGKKVKDGHNIWGDSMNQLFLWFGLILSALTYYILMYFERSIEFLLIFNIIPLFGVVYFLLCLSRRNQFTSLSEVKRLNWVIRFVGGLCLEVYIVQRPLLTDKFNSLFPANLLFIFMAIMVSAYCLRCIARLFSQTFSDDNYDIKKIIKAF